MMDVHGRTPRFAPAIRWLLTVCTFLCVLSLTAAADVDYELAVADSMRRVRIDQAYTGPSDRAGAMNRRPNPSSVENAVRGTPSYDITVAGPLTASIAAAGDESQSFQILIMPKSADLQRVRVTASPLERAGGGRSIASEQVSFHQVGYVNTSRPSYGVERTGWFADPLLNPEHFDVKQGDVQPVWVTVHVPPDTPAGHYEGDLTVTADNAAPAAVRLHLRVWAFNIPRPGNLPVAFTWAEGGSRGIHGDADWQAKGLRQQYIDMLLEHRVGPDNIYRGSPPDVEDVAYAVEHGATAFNLFNVGWPTSYTDAQLRSIAGRVEAVWDRFRESGLADRAYIFGFDETYSERAIQQVYGLLGEQFPDLRRLACITPRRAVWDYVDIWAMSTGGYWHVYSGGGEHEQHNTMETLRRRGVEFWLYLSTAARPPIPNWFIESPLIESRNVLWHVYRHDADGFLYYFINHTTGPQTPIDEYGGPYTGWNPRSFMSYNGDGHLIYAGKNSALPSIRLANIRDGLQDYEYFYKLEQLLIEHGMAEDRARAREHINREYVGYAVTNFWIHTHDPGVLRTLRRRVAEAIEELSLQGVAWSGIPDQRGGDPVPLDNLRFNEREATVTASTLHARAAGARRFEAFPLPRQDGELPRTAAIPGRLTESGPVEFYFEVQYDDGSTVYTPEEGADGPVRFTPDLHPPTEPAALDTELVRNYRVELLWGDAEDDGRIAAYEVWRGAEARTLAETGTRLAELGPHARAFADDSPPANSRVVYGVRAIDAVGRRGAMRTLPVNVPPNMPPAHTPQVRAAGVSRAVVVTWSSDVEPDVVAVEILAGPAADGPFETLVRLDNPRGGSWTHEGIEPGRDYFYTARLIDSEGLQGESGPPAGARPMAYVRRINCGGEEFEAPDGIAWEADRGRMRGTGIFTFRGSVSGAGDLAPVYTTERWGQRTLTYRFDDLAPGRYRVVLHLAETNPSFQSEGARPMTVLLNGEEVDSGLDVYARSGAGAAMSQSYEIRIGDAARLEVRLDGEQAGPMLKGLEVYGDTE